MVLLVGDLVHFDEKVERDDGSCILSERQYVGILGHVRVGIVVS